jgi:hypothetical protein
MQGNGLLHCFTLPTKVKLFSFIANAAYMEAKYASALMKQSE